VYVCVCVQVCVYVCCIECGIVHASSLLNSADKEKLEKLRYVCMYVCRYVCMYVV
jgi:hypothetical protein